MCYVNNNLGNIQQRIELFDTSKVTYYGGLQKNHTLQTLVDLANQNRKMYMGYIDWSLSDIAANKSTTFWIACNWLVIGIADSGLYLLDKSALAWKKM